MSIDDNDDNLLISWTDKRNGNWEIFFTRNTDNVKILLKNSINVSNSPNGKSENVEIVLDQDNNNTYITFLDNKAGEIGPLYCSKW